MKQPIKQYLIRGELTDQQKILHDIDIIIETKQVTRKHRAKITFSEIKLTHDAPVPDGGPYILQFVFKDEQYENQVYLNQGVLIRS
jgi:hypothetical protein